MDDASKFAEIICIALDLKTPDEIREEELAKVIATHCIDYIDSLQFIYRKIFDIKYDKYEEEYIDDLKLILSL